MRFDDLPPELGQEIFLRCVPTGDKAPRAWTAPIIFLTISKAWRTLALGTPHLWTSLSIEIWGGKSYPPLPDLNGWLERSGTFPLSFTLRQMTTWGDDDRMTSKVIRKLLNHLHRWQDVALTLASAMSIRSLSKHQRRIPGGLRSMNIYFSLSISVLRASDIDKFSRTLFLFTKAPCFRSLAIHGASVINITDISSEVQWEGLTEIRLGEIDSTSTCLKLFAVCKNLIRCSLGVRASDLEDTTLDVPLEVICLSNLSFLAISTDEAGMREIFGRLRVPQLRELCVTSTSVAWPQTAFVSLLDRSRCSLIRTSFLNTRMHPDDFLEVLSHHSMASLVCLVLQEDGWLPEGWVCAMSKNVIERMTPDERETDVVLSPCLESLILSGRCVEDECGPAIVHMVLLRHTQRTLKQFSWTNQSVSSRLDEQDRKRLSEAEATGLELSVGWIGDTWWEV